jgi:UDP-glucose 4-epimerase
MRVLVTGGVGYIGCHGARALARRGHDVVIYDHLSIGHRELATGFELVEGHVAHTTKALRTQHPERRITWLRVEANDRPLRPLRPQHRPGRN